MMLQKTGRYRRQDAAGGKILRETGCSRRQVATERQNIVGGRMLQEAGTCRRLQGAGCCRRQEAVEGCRRQDAVGGRKLLEASCRRKDAAVPAVTKNQLYHSAESQGPAKMSTCPVKFNTAAIHRKLIF